MEIVTPMASAAGRFKVVVLLLFIHCLLLLPWFVCVFVGPSFVLQYFVSFLELQSSRWEGGGLML